MKYLFEVRGTDCINYSNGEKGAGDDIWTEERMSLKAAINAGEKMLKDPKIYSVWIEKHEISKITISPKGRKMVWLAGSDKLGQWVNYKDCPEGWVSYAV